MGRKKPPGGDKASPAPAEKPAPEDANLAVLRRKDPGITRIVATSGHVVVYKHKGGWEKKNVEGPLFVVHRSKAPLFRMVILNRVNIYNLIEDLTAEFQLERNGPYLMYRNAKDEINGFWFPDETALEAMHTTLTTCVEKLVSGNAAPGHTPKPRPAAPAPKAIQQPKRQPAAAPQQPPAPRAASGKDAAASIMAAIGMPVAAPPQPRPQQPQAQQRQVQQQQPPPQNQTAPAPGAVQQPSPIQFAASAVAHALGALSGGGPSLTPQQVQAQLLQLSQNPQFVKMVTDSQGR